MLSQVRSLYEKVVGMLAVGMMKNEKGQGLVEYALILVLIAIVVMAMVKGIGGSANTAFSKVNSGLQ